MKNFTFVLDRTALHRVEKTTQNLNKLPCAGVTLRRRRHGIEAVVLRFLGREARDQIPSGSAIADVVQRSQRVSQRVRLDISGGDRGDQTNLAGRGCEGRKQAERLDLDVLVLALARNGRIAMVPYRGGIGQEYEVQLAPLSDARAMRSVAQAHGTVRWHARHKPAGGMVPDGMDRHPEDHLVLKVLCVSHCDNQYHYALIRKPLFPHRPWVGCLRSGAHTCKSIRWPASAPMKPKAAHSRD